MVGHFCCFTCFTCFTRLFLIFLSLSFFFFFFLFFFSPLLLLLFPSGTNSFLTGTQIRAVAAAAVVATAWYLLLFPLPSLHGFNSATPSLRLPSSLPIPPPAFLPFLACCGKIIPPSPLVDSVIYFMPVLIGKLALSLIYNFFPLI